MKWAAEEAAQIAKANTMGELEAAMNNPAVTEIFCRNMLQLQALLWFSF